MSPRVMILIALCLGCADGLGAAPETPETAIAVDTVAPGPDAGLAPDSKSAMPPARLDCQMNLLASVYEPGTDSLPCL